MVEKQSMKKPDFLRVFFTFVEEVHLYTFKKRPVVLKDWLKNALSALASLPSSISPETLYFWLFSLCIYFGFLKNMAITLSLHWSFLHRTYYREMRILNLLHSRYNSSSI